MAAGDELTSPSGPLLDRVAAIRAALAARGGLAIDQIEPRVAASAVHLGMTARLISPALGAAVLRRPLDMRPEGVWWQDAPGGLVPLSVPVPDGGDAVAREPGQRGQDWDTLLFDALLVPMTAAIAQLFQVSGRVLWGNIASAVNAAGRQVAAHRPDLAADGWQAAGRLFGSRWLSDERNRPGPAFRRSSCCLFYRLAPEKASAVCGDCVLALRSVRTATEPRRRG